MTQRLGWDEYFMTLVASVGLRATCDRGRSGCVIVRDKRIVCTGYVGSPAGLPHCDEVGHLLRKVVQDDGTTSVHCARTLHAEQNALLQAARHGLTVEGATLYSTMEPCRTCAMMISSVGIERVVAGARYHAGSDSRSFLLDARIELIVVNSGVLTY
jgi:dCMP deaminase